MSTRQLRITITGISGATAINASRIEWKQKGRVPEATDITWLDALPIALEDADLLDLCSLIADYLVALERDS